jgi:hypothetical protein
VQVFRNGILEATKANILAEHEGQAFVPGAGIEHSIFERVLAYLDGLRDAGVPPPFLFLMTLEGVEGAIYAISQNAQELPPFTQPVVTLPECLIDSYGDNIDYHRAVRPAFDTLWNSVGEARDMLFDDNGLWDGNWH